MNSLIAALLLPLKNHRSSDSFRFSNPARFITSPKYSSPEMDFYSEDEVALLLSAVKGTDFEALLQLAVTTGLRQSELLALKWSDVDWKRNTFS